MKSKILLSLLAIMAVIAIALSGPWRHPDWWFTPAQQSANLFQEKKYDEAAKVADDPARQGAALYRAGHFKEAALAFARDPSAAGAFNRGNAFVMQGKYDDAVKSYDRALELQADWPVAKENRKLATIRRDRLKTEGGDETGGQVKPDQIVFGKGKKGETVQVDGGKPLNDEQLQAVWLRRVQTKPADFLRAKFAFQLAEEKQE